MCGKTDKKQDEKKVEDKKVEEKMEEEKGVVKQEEKKVEGQEKREPLPKNVILVRSGKKVQGKDGKVVFEDNFEKMLNIMHRVYNQEVFSGNSDCIVLKASGSQVNKAISLALHRDFDGVLTRVDETKIYTRFLDKQGTRQGDEGKNIKIRMNGIDIVLKKVNA